jgi:hypothetical protein
VHHRYGRESSAPKPGPPIVVKILNMCRPIGEKIPHGGGDVDNFSFEKAGIFFWIQSIKSATI